MSRRRAAGYIEVNPGTITRTMRRDGDFARRVARAEAMADLEPIAALYQAQHKSWRAAAWLLQYNRAQRERTANLRSFSASDMRTALFDLVLYADELAPGHVHELHVKSAEIVDRLKEKGYQRMRDVDGEPYARGIPKCKQVRVGEPENRKRRRRRSRKAL